MNYKNFFFFPPDAIKNILIRMFYKVNFIYTNAVGKENSFTWNNKTYKYINKNSFFHIQHAEIVQPPTTTTKSTILHLYSDFRRIFISPLHYNKIISTIQYITTAE